MAANLALRVAIIILTGLASYFKSSRLQCSIAKTDSWHMSTPTVYKIVLPEPILG